MIKVSKSQYDNTEMTSDFLNVKKITVKIDTFIFDTIPANENIEFKRVNKQQCNLELHYPYFYHNKVGSKRSNLNEMINKIVYNNKTLLPLCKQGNISYKVDFKLHYFKKYKLLAIRFHKEKHFKEVPPHIKIENIHYSLKQNKFLDFDDIFDSNKKKLLIKILSDKSGYEKARINVSSFLLTKDNVVFNQENRMQRSISVEYDLLKEKNIINYAK
jgi:hypothetical protein